MQMEVLNNNNTKINFKKININLFPLRELTLLLIFLEASKQILKYSDTWLTLD